MNRSKRIARWLTVLLALLSTAPALADDAANRDAPSRRRPLRTLIQRLLESGRAGESGEAATGAVTGEMAFQFLETFVKQLVKDQQRTPEQLALEQRYVADPLAQQVFAVLSERKAADFTFDDDDISDVLKLVRPIVTAKPAGEATDAKDSKAAAAAKVKEDEAWEEIERQVIAELDELPDFSADRDVNRLMDTIFRVVAQRLGDGKPLAPLQQMNAALVFQNFLKQKKAETFAIMKQALAEADAIRSSGRDPAEALRALAQPPAE